MTQLPPLIKGCCPEGKRRVLLTVSYDGTAYAGWQRQQNALAVQQVLEEALRKLTGEAIDEPLRNIARLKEKMIE